jgi:hypothetical protein
VFDSGTTVKTAFLCRDKPAMKEALRAAGIPCAQSTGTTSAEEVRSFVKYVGYPVILKPRNAAGAAGTFRAGNEAELEVAIEESGASHGSPVAVEEFIEGHEGFYDTLAIEGRVVHDFACHYFPNVLEAMRTRWINPQILVTNRIEDPSYDEVKNLGQKVIRELGIGTSATHMEWFFGPKGLKFSEIGCRPPGVRVWDLYGRRERSRHVRRVGQGDRARPHRRAPVAPFRGGHDRAASELRRRDHRLRRRREDPGRVRQAHLRLAPPPPGSKTQSVSGGYMANAWMRLRHPDYDELRKIMNAIGETVKVNAKPA